MRTTYKPITILLGVLIALSIVGPVGMAGAAVGDKIGIHPHTNSRVFDRPYHHLKGRVGIVNKSKHKVTIKCQVVVLLDGPGTTHKRGFDTFKSTIKRGDKKNPHFHVKIKDKGHKFNNIETSTKAHCHKQ